MCSLAHTIPHPAIKKACQLLVPMQGIAVLLSKNCALYLCSTVIQKKCTPDQSFPITHQGRVAALQSLSGTGSLRVGAGFIARFLKGRTVYISNPTWGNHRNIFGDEGVKWEYYR